MEHLRHLDRVQLALISQNGQYDLLCSLLELTRSTPVSTNELNCDRLACILGNEYNTGTDLAVVENSKDVDEAGGGHR